MGKSWSSEGKILKSYSIINHEKLVKKEKRTSEVYYFKGTKDLYARKVKGSCGGQLLEMNNLTKRSR